MAPAENSRVRGKEVPHLAPRDRHEFRLALGQRHGRRSGSGAPPPRTSRRAVRRKVHRPRQRWRARGPRRNPWPRARDGRKAPRPWCACPNCAGRRSRSARAGRRSRRSRCRPAREGSAARGKATRTLRSAVSGPVPAKGPVPVDREELGVGLHDGEVEVAFLQRRARCRPSRARGRGCSAARRGAGRGSTSQMAEAAAK